jgi:putative ATP-dependent endonuclease of OLD family
LLYLKTTPAVFINGYGNQITEHQPFAYRRNGEVIRVNGRYNNVGGNFKIENMHLSNIKIWNFRKFGENDSGKTAIVDAIKHVLLTQSKEFIGIDEYDFHCPHNGIRSEKLKIECTFSGFDNEGSEAGNFLEWIGFDTNGKYELKVRLTAELKNNRVIADIRAGADDEGSLMDSKARDLLRTTYLKPLRDAEAELTPGNKSRLAQILKSHPVFDKSVLKTNSYKNLEGKEIHPLEDYISIANESIENFFKEIEIPSTIGDNKIKAAKQIRDDINHLLVGFFPDGEINEENKNPNFKISGSDLSAILQKLSLTLEENKSGLGSLNLLFIATELLLMQTERVDSLRLLLIEEIEAHLHAQAQLRLIGYLKNQQDKQVIITTHSNILGSQIPLENLIICKADKAFPMDSKHTQLESGDYKFLQRFLDATKANLFFARGVIIVEGDAENLLIPTIAEIIEKPLHKYGVSIVNVGSTAFKRYATIFLRKDETKDLDLPAYQNEWLDIPISIITDLDIRPIEYYQDPKNEDKSGFQINDTNIEEIKKISPLIDFEVIKDKIFTSASSFDTAINSAKKEKKNLAKSIRTKIKTKAKFDNITNEIITTIKGEKLNEKKTEISKQNIKTFVAQNWTLEYELALSLLKEFYYEAVLRAEQLQSDNSLILGDEIKQQIKDDCTKFFNGNSSSTPEKIAYDIYKPLMNGNVSKAITAQCLAGVLNENADHVKDLILTPKTLENPIRVVKDDVKTSTLGYLIDTIIHATTKPNHHE